MSCPPINFTTASTNPIQLNTEELPQRLHLLDQNQAQPSLTTSIPNSQSIVSLSKSKVDIAEYYLAQYDWDNLERCVADSKLPNKERYKIFCLIGRRDIKFIDRLFRFLGDFLNSKNKDYDLTYYLLRANSRLNLEEVKNSTTIFYALFDLVEHEENYDIEPSQNTRDAIDFLYQEREELLKHPHTSELMLGALLEIGEYEKGLECCNAAVLAQPNYRNFKVFKVIFYIAKGENEAARELLESIPSFYKPHVDAALKLVNETPISDPQHLRHLLIVIGLNLKIFIPERKLVHYSRALLEIVEQKAINLEVVQITFANAYNDNPTSDPINCFIGHFKINHSKSVTLLSHIPWHEHFFVSNDFIYNFPDAVESLVEYYYLENPSRTLSILERGYQLDRLSLPLRKRLIDWYTERGNNQLAKQHAESLYNLYAKDRTTEPVKWVALLSQMSIVELRLQNFSKAKEWLKWASKKHLRMQQQGCTPEIVEYYDLNLKCIRVAILQPAGPSKDATIYEALLDENLKINPAHPLSLQMKVCFLLMKREWEKVLLIFESYAIPLLTCKDMFGTNTFSEFFTRCLYFTLQFEKLSCLLVDMKSIESMPHDIMKTALHFLIDITLTAYEVKFNVYPEGIEPPSVLTQNNVNILKKMVYSQVSLLEPLTEFQCFLHVESLQIHTKSSLKAIEKLLPAAYERAIKIPFSKAKIEDPIYLDATLPKKESAAAAAAKEPASEVSSTASGKRRKKRKDKKEVKDEHGDFITTKNLEEKERLHKASQEESIHDIVRYDFRQKLERLQSDYAFVEDPIEVSVKPESKVTLVGKAHTIILNFSEIEKSWLSKALSIIPHLSSATICDAPVERKMNEIYYNLFKIFETLKRVFPTLSTVRDELRHNFLISYDELLTYAKLLLKDNYLENHLHLFLKEGKVTPMFHLPVFQPRARLEKSDFIRMLKEELNLFDLWFGKMRGEGDILKADPGLHRTLKGVHQRIGQILRALRDSCGIKFSPAINQIIATSNFSAHREEGDIDIFPPEECLEFLNALPNKLHQLLKSEAASTSAAAAAAPPKQRM